MNPNASVFDPSFIDYYTDYSYGDTYDDPNMGSTVEGEYFHVSTFSEPNQQPDVYSSITFDPTEEIIWTGTSTVCQFQPCFLLKFFTS